MSYDSFSRGILVGRSSSVMTRLDLKKSLGDWAAILMHLDRFTARNELELVASINYILGKPLELTPPLKASIAVDFVNSEKKILISDQELLRMGETHAQEKEEKQ